MAFDWGFFWRYLLEPSSVYLHGLWLTLSLSVISQGLGTVIGLFAALGRLSRFRSIQAVVRFYVWVMRGTPLLVQIVFIYTGLAAGNIFRFEDIDLGIIFLPGNIQAAIVALSLNEGAYMSEIIRAGIASVDIGQTEAAKSLGMTYWKLMRRIILPQAARVIIPPLGNDFNGMLKNTTLVSVIGSLLAFDQFYLMTAGQPGNETATSVFFVYLNSFPYLKLGYGSALSLILAAIILVCTAVQMAMTRRSHA